MTFTVNLTTSVGQVRLLIPDRVEARAQFSDEELTAFLSLEGDVVSGAAALALETLASQIAQEPVRKQQGGFGGQDATIEYSPKVLLERAKLLRAQSVTPADDPVEGQFDWAELVTEPFSADERLWAQRLRLGV
jgi:hypothetical protein